MRIDKRTIRGLVRLLCIGLLLLTACRDDDFYGGKYCPEGEPATISLRVLVPDMGVKTRTVMSDEDAAKVNNLWLGIYNKNTKKCTTNCFFEDPENKDMHQLSQLDNIETRSGESYIVAVANVTGTGNVGYCGLELKTKEGSTILAGERRELKELLLAADTWDQFTAISAVHVIPGNVSILEANLVMAGVYQNYEVNDNDDGWDGNNVVEIQPGMNELKGGAIHLRRLLSYVKFNIIMGGVQEATDGKDGVYDLQVTLQNWKVCNVPTLSFLHEQSGNAGDNADYLSGSEKKGIAINYASSVLGQNFTDEMTDDQKNCKTFDFYQYENKHTGVKTLDQYDDREKEYKNDDGTNTGIYSSLCETPNKDNPNNFASYVEIKAEVSYFTDAAKKIHRTGNVIYRIHLGYCEGDDKAAKAKDFNCRRNTKYTYNVIIKGLDKVVVEAKKEGDNFQHGVEGDVYDTDTEIIDFDSHYGVYNIHLSNRERCQLEYLITAPYDAEIKEVRRIKIGEEYIESGKEDAKFYNWIRFKPTTNAETLAVYKDEVSGDAWTLDDLIRTNEKGMLVNVHTRDLKNGDPKDENQLYYTVFIDENVYHNEQDDGNETNNEWWKYVNKVPRTLFLSIQGSEVSSDGNSRYGKAKYMIRQKSIQTYYKTDGNHSLTALGVEHINESSGLNLRWSNNVTTPTGGTYQNGTTWNGWNPDNGRWNMWFHVKNKNWTSFVKQEEITSIPKVDNDYMGTRNGGKGIHRLGVTHPTVALLPIEGENYLVTNWDPNSTDKFYEPISACLSRNRDLNGNGMIDENELRWYLPAMGKYARIVLGRQSLESPLVDPTSFNPAEFEFGQENSCFHYVSSDGLILWAEEGMSIGRRGVTGKQWESAWEIRCIRNLGVNLNNVVADDPIQRAYTVDTENRTIEMKYYASGIRTTPVDNLGVHSLIDGANQPYYKFQYAVKDCESPTTAETGEAYIYNATSKGGGYTLHLGAGNHRLVWAASVNANSICSMYSEKEDGSDRGKWRVPNQKELSIMRREEDKIFDVTSNTYCLWQWVSCTQEFLGDGTRFSTIYYNRRDNADEWGNTASMEYSAPDENTINFVHVRCVRDVVE